MLYIDIIVLYGLRSDMRTCARIHNASVQQLREDTFDYAASTPKTPKMMATHEHMSSTSPTETPMCMQQLEKHRMTRSSGAQSHFTRRIRFGWMVRPPSLLGGCLRLPAPAGTRIWMGARLAPARRN